MFSLFPQRGLTLCFLMGPSLIPKQHVGPPLAPCYPPRHHGLSYPPVCLTPPLARVVSGICSLMHGWLVAAQGEDAVGAEACRCDLAVEGTWRNQGAVWLRLSMSIREGLPVSWWVPGPRSHIRLLAHAPGAAPRCFGCCGDIFSAHSARGWARQLSGGIGERGRK